MGSKLTVKQIEAAKTPAELVLLLLETGERLNPRLKQKILTADAMAIPLLLEVLQDEGLQAEDGPGDGWAPIHATKLLGTLRAEAAIPRMLQLLVRADAMEIIYSTLIFALIDIGAPVLEPALAVREQVGAEARIPIDEVLAGLGVKDERIYQALLADAAHDPTTLAGFLAGYGDPRAIPVLGRLLDSQVVVEPDHFMANQEVIELADAIEDLGGKLSATQERRLQRVKGLRRDAFSAREDDEVEAVEEPTRKPGRNEPCWCGSGKKYKKCHEAADEGRAPPDR